MQYLGGKWQIRKWVAATIEQHRRPGQLVWEPFCGGLGASCAIAEPLLCTDVHPGLIALYEALRAGWLPPEQIDAAAYQIARHLPDADPFKALVGFGASFGGKWFGGYASDNIASGQCYYAGSIRVLRRKLAAIPLARFACLDFLAITPQPTDALIYCDPPYHGTTGYAGIAAFDHAHFVALVRTWAQHTTVLVSEQDFPPGAGVCVAERQRRALLAANANKPPRTERIFKVLP